MKKVFFLIFIALLNSCSNSADDDRMMKCGQNAEVTVENKNPYFGLNCIVHNQNDLKWYAKIIGDTLTVKRKYSYDYGGQMIIYKFLCQSNSCPKLVNVKAFGTHSGCVIELSEDEAPPIFYNYNGFNYQQVFEQVDNFDFTLQEYIPNIKFVARIKTNSYNTINGGSFDAWDAKIWIDLSNMNDF